VELVMEAVMEFVLMKSQKMMQIIWIGLLNLISS